MKFYEEEYTFNGVKNFSEGFKNLAKEKNIIDYTDINIENDNTVIFNNLIFDK